MSTVNRQLRPYYDDYNKEKRYHNILFRPSYAVQTRELNQLQSIFDEQIARHGEHIFKNGSVVIPGALNYDNEYRYVKVVIDDYSSIVDDLKKELNLRLITQSNGLVASVLEFVDVENNDYATFYVRYTNSGNDNETFVFADNDIANIININDQLVGTCTIIETGKTSRATIDNGVYFVNKKFVLVERQSLRLSKYNNKPSVSVGFDYEESIVTENEDSTLYDNASGTSNFTAPGAHRLKITLTLSKIDLGEEHPKDFVELMQIENGELKVKARGPEYNVLDQTLARRTYEESGDYTVKPFVIDVKEHLQVPGSGVDGEFTVEEGGDEDKYAVVIDPGLAYVRGYRVESLKSLIISGDKSRDTYQNNNSSSLANFGKYLLIDNIFGRLDTTTYQKINFYDGNLNGNGSVPQGNKVGTANVRSLYIGSDKRLYLFNIRDINGKTSTSFLRNAKSVYSTSGNFTFTAKLEDSLLYDTDNSSALFYLNSDYVQTLLDESQNTDTNYTTIRKFSGTVDSNGDILLTSGANESFIEFNNSYSSVIKNSSGESLSVLSNSLSGQPLGSSIVLNVGSGNASENVTILIQINKQQSIQKNKTISTNTDNSINETNGRFYLSKPDVIKILSVKDSNNNDITGNFSLVINSNDDYYGYSYLKSNSSNINTPIKVEYEYFQHGNGDYFSVDSYSTVPYKDIPVQGAKPLTDYLDFRPIVDQNGEVVSTGDTIHNNSIINSDVTYYLSRIDKVFVNSEGEFGIVKGSSSLSPKEPKTPENSLDLAILTLLPYTANANNDISKRIVKNKRYTMSDIGKLENRVKNLEYYVTLSMLEQQTANNDIYDDMGLDRFKNGFIVDDFNDHEKSNWTDPNYRCSVGPMGIIPNSLKPEFTINAIDTILNEDTSSNIIVKNGLAMIDYDEVSFLRQDLASSSINVNPYAIFRWDGDLTLNPAVDNWIDVVYNEPKVNYSVIQNGKLQQSWTTFSLTWTAGSESSMSQSKSSKVVGAFTSNTRRSGGKIYQDYNEIIQDTTTVTLTNQDTNIEEIADHLLDKVSIPYMRSKTIEVTIKGMKPFTRMHFFFDGIKVNDYVKPDGGNLGDKVVTDIDGEVVAYFTIPNEFDMKFRTGVRVLEVTDNPDNDRENSDAYANGEYQAEGIRETRMKELNATRSIQTTSIQSTETRTQKKTRVVGYYDPLAQSFLVETRGGVFATSIDLFFRTKDDESYPITCDIRVMENGFPTQEIVPNSAVTLKPSEVSVSDDSSIATTFEFKAPVHLKQGTEYCFVIHSNSNKYEAWKATMGEADILTQKAISEQPFIGVMFKSQNSSTWSEDQLSDLKFEIRRAEFKHSSATVNFINKDQELLPLDNNPIEVYQGQTYFDLHIDDGHTYIEGASVTLSGLTGGAGFNVNDLNKKHIIDSIISPTIIRIETNVSGTSDTKIGGIDGFRTNTVQYSMINPNVEMLNFESTSTHLFLKGVTGKSIDGDEIPYLKNEPYVALSNKELNHLTKVYAALNDDEEQDLLSGDNSFDIRIQLNSDRANLSPIVDLQRTIFVTPMFLVDNKSSDENDGSNCFTKYLSNPTTVDNPTTALQIYADDYVPQNAKIIYSVRVGNSADELEEADWEIVHTSTSRVSVFFEEIDILKEYTNDFTWFQTMIQIKSKYASDTPKVRNLRTIALGT